MASMNCFLITYFIYYTYEPLSKTKFSIILHKLLFILLQFVTFRMNMRNQMKL